MLKQSFIYYRRTVLKFSQKFTLFQQFSNCEDEFHLRQKNIFDSLNLPLLKGKGEDSLNFPPLPQLEKSQNFEASLRL